MRASLFNASQATKALALPYTPPLQRDLVAPWHRPLELSHHVECGEEVDYTLFIFTAHQHGDFRSPRKPLISVSTAQEKHYKNGTHEDYSTSIWFHDRASFRAAWRIARLLCKRGNAMITKRDERQVDSIDLGFEHCLCVWSQ